MSVPGDPTDAVPGDAMPGHAVPGEAMPGDAMPGGGVAGGGVAGDAVPRAASPWRREAAVAAVITTVCAALGVPFALLWAHVAPRAELVAQDHHTYVASSLSKALIGADAYFFLFAIALGLVCGIAAVFPGRHYGVGAALGLALGCLAGAWIAAHLGASLSPGPTAAELARRANGTTAKVALSVHATGVLIAWPLVAVATYLVGLLFQPLPHETEVRGDAAWPFGGDTEYWPGTPASG